MSFPRHEGIFRSDGLGSCRSVARSERLHAPTHRLDEFPTGYSSAGWSPPEPASASPAEQKFTMKAAPQPSLFRRMGKPCLAGCLTVGVHRSSRFPHPPPGSFGPRVRARSPFGVRPTPRPFRPVSLAPGSLTTYSKYGTAGAGTGPMRDARCGPQTFFRGYSSAPRCMT